MLAAVQREPGGALSLEESADPAAPAGDEVIVAMRRMPINPADLLLIEGSYGFFPGYPQVIGAEGVGEVVAVGNAVSNLSVGDRVLPLSRGNWATHRRLKRGDLVRLSPSLSLDAAAVLRINPATAWRMLDIAPAEQGDWIIQNGAGSMVARWIRRLALDRRRPVIDVLRRPGSPTGSDHIVIDVGQLAQAARNIVGEGRVSLALDCVAGEASGRLAETLAPGGTMLLFGHLSGRPCTIPSALLTGRQLCVRGFSLRPDEEGSSNSELQALFDKLAVIAGEPEMAPVVAAHYPLSALDEALRHAKSPDPGGRVLLTVGE